MHAIGSAMEVTRMFRSSFYQTKDLKNVKKKKNVARN